MSIFEKIFSYTTILLVFYSVAAYFVIETFYDGYSEGFAAILFVAPAMILSFVYGAISVLVLLWKRYKQNEIDRLLKIAISINLIVLLLMSLRMLYLDIQTW